MTAIFDEQNPYYNLHAVAGQEVSSTGEGRHIMQQLWDVYWDEITYPNELIVKGLPCYFGAWGAGVGVAFQTAQGYDKVIAIDTEGIWRLLVNVDTSVGVGEVIFINFDGTLTNVFDIDSVQTVFGYSMENVLLVDGLEDVVLAVKVHWMWPWWFYILEDPWERGE